MKPPCAEVAEIDAVFAMRDAARLTRRAEEKATP